LLFLLVEIAPDSGHVGVEKLLLRKAPVAVIALVASFVLLGHMLPQLGLLQETLLVALRANQLAFVLPVDVLPQLVPVWELNQTPLSLEVGARKQTAFSSMGGVHVPSQVFLPLEDLGAQLAFEGPLFVRREVNTAFWWTF
jgi:hypothetical protein